MDFWGVLRMAGTLEMQNSSVGNVCCEYCVIFPLISILSYVNYFPATVPTTAENKDDIQRVVQPLSLCSYICAGFFSLSLCLSVYFLLCWTKAYGIHQAVLRLSCYQALNQDLIGFLQMSQQWDTTLRDRGICGVWVFIFPVCLCTVHLPANRFFFFPRLRGQSSGLNVRAWRLNLISALPPTGAQVALEETLDLVMLTPLKSTEDAAAPRSWESHLN